MRCNRCGAELGLQETFCANCGERNQLLDAQWGVQGGYAQSNLRGSGKNRRMLRWIPLLVLGVTMLIQIICNSLHMSQLYDELKEYYDSSEFSLYFFESTITDMIHAWILLSILPILLVCFGRFDAKSKSFRTLLILSSILLGLQLLGVVLGAVYYDSEGLFVNCYMNIIPGSFFVPFVDYASTYLILSEVLYFVPMIAMIVCAALSMRSTAPTVSAVLQMPYAPQAPMIPPVQQTPYQSYAQSESDDDGATRLLTNDVCRACGKTLSPNERFCSSCGRDRYPNG